MAAALLLLLLVGCTDPQSPEQQVRGVIDAAEIAVQQQSLVDSRALISPGYRDSAGRSRAELMRLLAGYFLRHRSIHLLVQINSIDFPDPSHAAVVLYVAMAGSAISAPDQFSALRANLYRFDLVLQQQEQTWQLSSGRWRPATRGDFL